MSIRDDRTSAYLEIEWEALSYEQREQAQAAYEIDYGESADLYNDLLNCPEAAAPYINAFR